MVTLFTKPNCVQCTMTARSLNQNGIEFDSIDVSQDQAALDQILDMGYRQVPVVMTQDNHWSGFKPENIKALAN